jgi:hypothetical protein
VAFASGIPDMGILDSITSFLPSAPVSSSGAHSRPVFTVDDNEDVHSVEVESDVAMWGEDGFSFADLLDVVNPLQHLPVVGQIYRGITGDEISPAARLAGGTIFGGPIGLVAAVANNAVESATGRDIGETVIAAMQGDEGPAGQAAEVKTAALDAQGDTGAGLQPAPAEAATITAASLPTLPERQGQAPANRVTAATTGNLADAQSRPGTVIFEPPVRRVDVANTIPTLGRAAPASVPAGHRGPGPIPSAGQLPSMSPAAFQALMNSIGAVPENRPSGRPGLTAGGNAALAPAADVRGTALEVHNLLKAHAESTRAGQHPIAR